MANYEHLVDPLTLPLGMYTLDLAQVGRGSRIIDVAAGTGALALVAAKRGAHVLATDIAPNGRKSSRATRAVSRLRGAGNGLQIAGRGRLIVRRHAFDHRGAGSGRGSCRAA